MNFETALIHLLRQEFATSVVVIALAPSSLHFTITT